MIMKEVEILPRTNVERFVFSIMSITVFLLALLSFSVCAYTAHTAYKSWGDSSAILWSFLAILSIFLGAILLLFSIVLLYDVYKSLSEQEQESSKR